MRPKHVSSGRIVFAFFLWLSFTESASFAATAQSLGDASTVPGDSGAWTIAAGGAALDVIVDPQADYSLTSLRGPSGTNWIRVSGADTTVMIDGTAYALGSRQAGFVLTSFSTDNDSRRLELDVSYTLRPQNLLVTRHIKVVPGSPTFEVWNSFQALGDPVSLSNLNAFECTLAPGA